MAESRRRPGAVQDERSMRSCAIYWEKFFEKNKSKIWNRQQFRNKSWISTPLNPLLKLKLIPPSRHLVGLSSFRNLPDMLSWRINSSWNGVAEAAASCAQFTKFIRSPRAASSGALCWSLRCNVIYHVISHSRKMVASHQIDEHTFTHPGDRQAPLSFISSPPFWVSVTLNDWFITPRVKWKRRKVLVIKSHQRIWCHWTGWVVSLKKKHSFLSYSDYYFQLYT